MYAVEFDAVGQFALEERIERTEPVRLGERRAAVWQRSGVIDSRGTAARQSSVFQLFTHLLLDERKGGDVQQKPLRQQGRRLRPCSDDVLQAVEEDVLVESEPVALLRRQATEFPPEELEEADGKIGRVIVVQLVEGTALLAATEIGREAIELNELGQYGPTQQTPDRKQIEPAERSDRRGVVGQRMDDVVQPVERDLVWMPAVRQPIHDASSRQRHVMPDVSWPRHRGQETDQLTDFFVEDVAVGCTLNLSDAGVCVGAPTFPPLQHVVVCTQRQLKNKRHRKVRMLQLERQRR